MATRSSIGRGSAAIVDRRRYEKEAHATTALNSTSTGLLNESTARHRLIMVGRDRLSNDLWGRAKGTLTMMQRLKSPGRSPGKSRKLFGRPDSPSDRIFGTIEEWAAAQSPVKPKKKKNKRQSFAKLDHDEPLESPRTPKSILKNSPPLQPVQDDESVAGNSVMDDMTAMPAQGFALTPSKRDSATRSVRERRQQQSMLAVLEAPELVSDSESSKDSSEESNSEQPEDEENDSELEEEEDGDSVNTTDADKYFEKISALVAEKVNPQDLPRNPIQMDAMVKGGLWDRVIAAVANATGEVGDRFFQPGASNLIALEDEDEEAKTADFDDAVESLSSADEDPVSDDDTIIDGWHKMSSKQRLKVVTTRQEIEMLVRKVAPKEVTNVKAILNQFAGREKELLHTLKIFQERAVPSVHARKSLHRCPPPPSSPFRFAPEPLPRYRKMTIHLTIPRAVAHPSYGCAGSKLVAPLNTLRPANIQRRYSSDDDSYYSSRSRSSDESSEQSGKSRKRKGKSKKVERHEDESISAYGDGIVGKFEVSEDGQPLRDDVDDVFTVDEDDNFSRKSKRKGKKKEKVQDDDELSRKSKKSSKHDDDDRSRKSKKSTKSKYDDDDRSRKSKKSKKDKNEDDDRSRKSKKSKKDKNEDDDRSRKSKKSEKYDDDDKSRKSTKSKKYDDDDKSRKSTKSKKSRKDKNKDDDDALSSKSKKSTKKSKENDDYSKKSKKSKKKDKYADDDERSKKSKKKARKELEKSIALSADEENFMQLNVDGLGDLDAFETRSVEPMPVNSRHSRGPIEKKKRPKKKETKETTPSLLPMRGFQKMRKAFSAVTDTLNPNKSQPAEVLASDSEYESDLGQSRGTMKRTGEFSDSSSSEGDLMSVASLRASVQKDTRRYRENGKFEKPSLKAVPETKKRWASVRPVNHFGASQQGNLFRSVPMKKSMKKIRLNSELAEKLYVARQKAKGSHEDKAKAKQVFEEKRNRRAARRKSLGGSEIVNAAELDSDDSDDSGAAKSRAEDKKARKERRMSRGA